MYSTFSFALEEKKPSRIIFILPIMAGSVLLLLLAFVIMRRKSIHCLKFVTSVIYQSTNENKMGVRREMSENANANIDEESILISSNETRG